MPTEFTLPELGENISSGDVVRVLVKPGDTINRDQPVLELETDKATVEVPSSVAGTVKEVRVKQGEKVNVGQAILVVEEGKEAAEKPGGGGAPPLSKEPAQAQKPPSDAKGAEAPKPVEGEDVSEGLAAASEAPSGRAPRGEVVDISRGARPSAEQGERARPAAPAPEEKAVPVPAAPSTRRLARELGVEIAQVRGSGPGGRIGPDDVKAHARQAGAGGAARPVVTPLPDFERWGEIDRQPMRAVRRKTAEHLSQAWTSIPHVTQFDKADITDLEHLRERFGPRAERGGGGAPPLKNAGGKLTLTAIAVKVVAAALKQFPQFNASIDPAAEEIVYKKYVHVGVAVDTDRGLLVPVIRDVDRKNVIQLAAEVAQAAEKARGRKLTLEEMEGGCFTITNLGGIGGTYFTPIVNAPEVAILGISRASHEPVYRDINQGRGPTPDINQGRGPTPDINQGRGPTPDWQFVPRLMLPLSLSYDHRAIDGADAIRFLRFVAEALEQPFLLALHG